MKRKAFGKYLWMFLTVALLCIAGVCTAEADDTVTVEVTGTYLQTEARSMLSMVNAFRTGDDAWYWNSDNTTKTTCSDLGELTYDYALEKIAMKRAIETAVYWSHTRPNGTKWYTLKSGSVKSYAENIAAATSYTSAKGAFNLWKEESQNYSGQGHRRTMLSSAYTAIGIAHVYYNGCHYWVQEFGYSVSSASATTANDAETTESIEIASSVITGTKVTISPETLTVMLGKQAALPTVSVGILTKESYQSYYCPIVVGDISWTIADSSIASIDGDSVTGKTLGTTSLSATVMEEEQTVPVTVQKVDLTNASVTVPDADYTYNGSAFTPTPTVTLNGETISASCYTVAYINNVNAGTATVTVTGTGDCEGTGRASFTIARRGLSSASLSDIAAQVYTGSSIKPAVTVTDNGVTLTEGTDYKLSCENNKDAGAASLTVTGTGNYTGSLTGSFTIGQANIADCSISTPSAKVYTTKAITPNVTVTLGTYTLEKDTDYTLSYANNTEIGTATITVQGIGNFTGSAEVNFKILSITAYFSGTSAARVIPVGGTTLMDASSGALYRVTQESAADDPVAVYRVSVDANATSVTIPDTITVKGRTCKVTAIADGAFKNNSVLKKVKIGKNVQTIGKNAFYGCTKLTTVTGGASLTKIGSGAFQKCTSLKKITIPAKVSSIGKKAFYGCKNLRSITIKTKLLTAKTVGARAFTGTYKKAAVKVPSGKQKAYRKILVARGLSKSAKVKK